MSNYKHTLRSKAVIIDDGRNNFALKDTFKHSNLENDFVINYKSDDRSAVISDLSTGLLWYNNYSDNFPDLSYNEAVEFTESINKSNVASINTWRIPTMDELLSLSDNNYHLKYPFSCAPKRNTIWSCDEYKEEEKSDEFVERALSYISKEYFKFTDTSLKQLRLQDIPYEIIEHLVENWKDRVIDVNEIHRFKNRLNESFGEYYIFPYMDTILSHLEHYESDLEKIRYNIKYGKTNLVMTFNEGYELGGPGKDKTESKNSLMSVATLEEE